MSLKSEGLIGQETKGRDDSEDVDVVKGNEDNSGDG